MSHLPLWPGPCFSSDSLLFMRNIHLHCFLESRPAELLGCQHHLFSVCCHHSHCQIKILFWGLERDGSGGSVVTVTSCSWRINNFFVSSTPGSSQLSVTSSFRWSDHLIPWLPKAPGMYVHGVHTYMQAFRHTHKINTFFETGFFFAALAIFKLFLISRLALNL